LYNRFGFVTRDKAFIGRTTYYSQTQRAGNNHHTIDPNLYTIYILLYQEG